jgi:hypothetical protein
MEGGDVPWSQFHMKASQSYMKRRLAGLPEPLFQGGSLSETWADGPPGRFGRTFYIESRPQYMGERLAGSGGGSNHIGSEKNYME